MSTEDWIDAWLIRRESLAEEEAWTEIEAWANENDSMARWTLTAQAYKALDHRGPARLAYKAALRACDDGSRGMAYSNYANFLLEIGELSEALPIFELAWENSRMPSIGLGFSSALLEGRQDHEALDFLEAEAESLGVLMGYWANLSIGMTRAGRYEEARQAARQALTLETSPETQFQWSLTALRLDGFAGEEALAAFESRPNRPAFESGLGEELLEIASLETHDRVVVICEQGIGDVLQFIPYASELESLGVSIIMAGSPRLESLVTHAFPSFHYVRSPVEAMKLRPRYWVPLLSLPKVLGTKGRHIVRSAYLKAPGQVSVGTSAESQTRIGLAWRGNPRYPNDHLRSTRLDAFLSVLNSERVEAYSLLLDIEEELNALPPTKGVLHSLAEGTDSTGAFVDTAALVAGLDAVITTDTSIAHLSAALGTCTYLLLNKGADWRWGSPTSPMKWYQSLQLIWLDEKTGFEGGVDRSLEAILEG